MIDLDFQRYTVDGWADDQGVTHVANWPVHMTECGRHYEGYLLPGGVAVTCEACLDAA